MNGLPTRGLLRNTFQLSTARALLCLSTLKEELGIESSGIRTLCPIRWSVRADSAAILANYNEIRVLWELALLVTSDTEMKARIRGIDSQMNSFRFLLGLLLSQIILRHTDKLSMQHYKILHYQVVKVKKLLHSLSKPYKV